MTDRPNILFTAFEPSGDSVAAPVIAKLIERRPDLKVWSFGGPRMCAAGASMIEDTTRHAVMLFDSVSQAWAHRQRVKRLRRWLESHTLAALIAVDSPAANWMICRTVRRAQPHARIIHLVAPQLWGWAPWRIGKLRRLTDHVLCLFPFEPSWFNERDVPATFVGHPAFDSFSPLVGGERGSSSLPNRSADAAVPPDASHKLLLLPGSRHGEIRKNWPTMLDAFRRLKQKHPALHAAVGAVDDWAVDLVRQLTRSSAGSDTLPDGMSIHAARTADLLHWCDLVLVVSGTAAFEVAVHRRPMVVMYNVSFLAWHLVGRWLVNTGTFSMPNVIAESNGQDRIVPELVPHFGDPAPLAWELDRLIESPEAAEAQVDALRCVTAPFAGQPYGEQACNKVLDLID